MSCAATKMLRTMTEVDNRSVNLAPLPDWIYVFTDSSRVALFYVLVLNSMWLSSVRSPTARQRSIHERPVGILVGFPGPNGHEGSRDESSYMREGWAGGDERERGRTEDIFHEISIRVGGLETVGKLGTARSRWK